MKANEAIAAIRAAHSAKPLCGADARAMLRTMGARFQPVRASRYAAENGLERWKFKDGSTVEILPNAKDV